MRWNCPHCGVNLAIVDDKVGLGWSFSRCYKCGGFALVRKVETNVVKVDRAPLGENVLLPEAAEQPLSILSENSIQNLERILTPRPMPPIVRTPPLETIPNIQKKSPPPMIPQVLPKYPPQALPPQRKLLPIAISIATVASIASGIYLYLQGRTLWKNSKIETSTYKANEVIPPPSLTSRVNHQEVVDHVRNQAMAPLRSIETHHLSALMIRPTQDEVELRAGPGTTYQKIGTAKLGQKYTVTNWNKQWFKISFTDPQGPRVGWIKTNQVEVVHE